MRRTLRLYGKLISLSIRSQMQHRASFCMLLMSHAIAACVDILGIWILFDRFQLIKGWTLDEVFILYGTVQMGYSVAESFGRGFDTFSKVVKYGDFDRMLLRPIGLMLQVAASEVPLMRLGRFLQGFIVLTLGFLHLGFDFFSWQTLMIFSAFLGTSCLFYGLLVVQGAISFWTIESLELIYIATYGAGEAGQYPVSIYAMPLRIFLTLIVPIGCVAYYPIATLLHHEGIAPFFAFMLPLVGVFFLFGASTIWNCGVRRYSSTGS